MENEMNYSVFSKFSHKFVWFFKKSFILEKINKNTKTPKMKGSCHACNIFMNFETFFSVLW